MKKSKDTKKEKKDKKDKKDKKKKPKKSKSKKISWDVPEWYGGHYSPYEYTVFTGKAPRKVRNTRQ